MFVVLILFYVVGIQKSAVIFRKTNTGEVSWLNTKIQKQPPT